MCSLLVCLAWFPAGHAVAVQHDGRAEPRPAAAKATPAPPRPVTAPEPAPAAGHETEPETIAKCLADLQDGDVSLRRRAVMILGKYAAPVAQAAVIGCLEDEDARVRQSALVALSERTSVPAVARKPVLHRLRDSDVHIRRIASSMLPDVLGVPRLYRAGSVTPRLGPVRSSARLDTEAAELLNEALDDADAIVRKNVLALGPIQGDPLETERLTKCLADSDREIRLLALRVLTGSGLAADELALVLKPLLTDADAVVRKETVSCLGRSAQVSLPLLRQFAADPDPGVKSQAVWELGRLRDASGFEHIVRLLHDDEIPLDLRKRCVPHLRHYRDRSIPLLRQLAGAGPAPLRAQALRTLGGLGEEGASIDFLVASLSSASVEVRKAAVQALRTQSHRVSREHVATLVESGHSDVRLAALQLTLLLPPEQAGQVIGDCLLDEDIGVRCAAIRYAGVKSVPNWELFLSQSLKDPSLEVQRAAAQALLARADKRSREILEAYVTDCPSVELAAYVRRRLEQAKKKKPRRPEPGSRPASRSVNPRGTKGSESK